MELLIGIVIGIVIVLMGKPLISTATTGKITEGQKAGKQVESLTTKVEKALTTVGNILDDAIEIDKKSTAAVQSIKDKINILKR